MIIIVGPDRCGKTSLARKLLEHLPRHYYYHHTKPPMNAYEYFARFFTTAQSAAIVDRCHLCEYAYGHAFRGGSELSPHEWRMLELYALGHQAQVILLTDTFEAISSRYSDREMFPLEGMTRVIGNYEIVKTMTKLPLISGNLRSFIAADGNETSAFLEIVKREASRIASNFYALPPALGHGRRGGFMIVGEAPSEPANDLAGGPFMEGPAAEWLWGGLEHGHVDWSRGYYVNASTFADAPEMFLWYTCNFVHAEFVVCLGRVADRLATRAKIPHVYVPHPAHTRRFHHDKFEEWAMKLCEPLGRWVR